MSISREQLNKYGHTYFEYEKECLHKMIDKWNENKFKIPKV